MSHRLEPGSPAPDFALEDADGCVVRRGDYAGRRFVLYAYPAAATPGCTKEADDFQENLAALGDLGLEVVGLSPDLPAKLAAFRTAQALTFPLLSDPERAVLSEYGAYGEKKLYGKTVTGVIRSTFVIDAEQRIERALYNVRATGHVAKLLRDLGA